MRYLYLFLLVIVTAVQKPARAAPHFTLELSAKQAILINAETGAILYEKKSHEPAYPASTTKIATALFAMYKARAQLETLFTAEREALASITPQLKRQSNYRSPPYWLETDGTHISLKRGEQMRLYDLLHALLLSSANDAANVIAQQIGAEELGKEGGQKGGGSIGHFMDGLNLFLKQLGCRNTHFNNPHGLHHPDHVTSAYDLALMAKTGLKDPLFRQIVSTVRYSCKETNIEKERILVQGNHLLRNGPYAYPYAIGVKTGTTQAAGKNLVAAAQKGDRTLIAVLLGCQNRVDLYQEVTALFDKAFQEPKMRRTLLPAGAQKLSQSVTGAKTALTTYLTQPLVYDFYPSEEAPVKVGIVWQLPTLPIAKNQCVGKVCLFNARGSLLQEQPLLAADSVEATLWHRLSHGFSDQPQRHIWMGSGALFLLLVYLLVLWRRRKLSR